MSKELPFALTIPEKSKKYRKSDAVEKRTAGEGYRTWVLVKHFVSRFIHKDSQQFENENTEIIVFALVFLGGWGGYIASSVDKLFFITIMMTVTGICCVITWDGFFLDGKDYYNLMMLPIKSRTIYWAKFLSLMAVVGTLSLSFCLVSTVIYAVSYKVPGGSGGFGLYLKYGFLLFLTNFLANWFIFLGTASVQAVFTLLFTGKLFLRISFWLQVGLLVGLASVFIWFPRLHGESPGLSHTFSSLHYYFPPLWFNGLHEKLNGGGEAIYSWHSSAAAAALLVPLLLYAFTLPLSLKRYLKHPLSGKPVFKPGIVLTRLKNLFHAIFLRNPVQRASFYFFIKVLKRCRDPKIHLALFVSLPVGLMLAYTICLKGITKEKFDPLNPHIIGIPFILFLLLIIGLRTLVENPIYFNANWIFKLTRESGSHHYISGTKKAMVFVLVLPLTIIIFAIYFYLGGIELAFSHTLYSFVTALLILEGLFFNYRKIPFTTQPNPGTLNLKTIWPLWAVGFLFSYFMFIKMGLLLLFNPQAMFLFYPLAGLIFFLLYRCKEKFTPENPLYEEESQESMLSLNSVI